MKPTENKGIAYHDGLADGWNDRYLSRGFRKRKTAFDRILGEYVESGKYWLDAGCGSGVLSKALADRGARVLGVDASVRMLESATQNVASYAASGQVRFQLVDSVENLIGVDGVFDGIVCSSVIEYVTAPERALAEFRSRLNLGGVLIVSVPNRYSLVRSSQKAMRGVGKVFRRDFAAYLRVSINDYSKADFRVLLESQGYRCLNCVEFDPILPARITGIPRSLLIFIAELSG